MDNQPPPPCWTYPLPNPTPSHPPCTRPPPLKHPFQNCGNIANDNLDFVKETWLIWYLFHWSLFLGFYWWEIIIGLDDRSARIGRQAIVETNGDSVQWYVSSALKGDALRYWGWDNMAANFLTIILNGIFLMKIYKFRLRFHWSLFLRVQSIY